METNDRNSKKIVNDKPKKVDKNDKNNSINTNKNTDKNINKNKKNLCNDNLKKENIKLRQKEPTVIKNNNKTFDAKSIENIKKNKLIKIEKFIQPNRTITKDSEILNHKNQTIINKNKKKKEEIIFITFFTKQYNLFFIIYIITFYAIYIFFIEN